MCVLCCSIHQVRPLTAKSKMGNTKKIGNSHSLPRVPTANCECLYELGIPEEVVSIIGAMKLDMEHIDYQEHMRYLMIARLIKGGKYKNACHHHLATEKVKEADELIKEFLDDHKDRRQFWQEFCLHVHENKEYIWSKFDKTGWWYQDHYSFKTNNSIPSSINLLFMYQYYYNLYYEDREYNLFCRFPKFIVSRP